MRRGTRSRSASRSTEQWRSSPRGRSALVNNHWTLAVQHDAIDFVQFVDGKTFRGDRSRLENFHIFGHPLLAVADGRITAAVDGHPDLSIELVPTLSFQVGGP